MARSPLIRLVSHDDLTALTAAFIDDCALANLGERTLEFYATNLQRYHWWCKTTGVPLDPLVHTSSTIRDFLRYIQSNPNRWNASTHNMVTRPMKASTMHAYFRVLRRFFNWLVEQEYLETSPVTRVRAPRVQQDQPDPFTKGELSLPADQLKRVGDTPLALRNRAIVAVLLDVGLRRSELAAVQVDQIDVTRGRLQVVEGKGGKSRQLVIGAAARRPVRRYWLRHRHIYGRQGPFFLSAIGESLTGDSVHEMTSKLGATAGVDPCHPHRFRHTFAVNAIRAGMNLFELQALLGHRTLDMVRRCVKLAEMDPEQASHDHSPLDRFKLRL